MSFQTVIEVLTQAVDLAGAVVIAGGILLVTLLMLPAVARGQTDGLYRIYRRRTGKAILLGLELLVAADIMRTVAIEPTIEGVVILALIVLVRTFLSFSLEVELYGRWPWQQKADDAQPTD